MAQVQEIVDVIAEVVPDGGTALARRAPQALAPAQAMTAVLAPRLEADPTYAPLWQSFQAAPEINKPILVGVVQVLAQNDAGLARKLDELLLAYRQAASPSVTTTINTSGGAYIGGSVKAGGDFVGRDKTTFTGDGIVSGDGNRVSVTKSSGAPGDAVAQLFAQAQALAQQKPPVVREEVEAAVETAQEETEAGEEADKRLLSKALDVLLEKGPDVLELVLNAILNPAAAAGKGAKMLANEAKSALQKRRNNQT
ncbi:MAG: hypothetical protein JXA21_15695 [Anaerolineae bacterium]|nr:hypothetical protein [Anaerolineae bacterium]